MFVLQSLRNVLEGFQAPKNSHRLRFGLCLLRCRGFTFQALALAGYPQWIFPMTALKSCRNVRRLSAMLPNVSWMCGRCLRFQNRWRNVIDHFWQGVVDVMQPWDNLIELQTCASSSILDCEQRCSVLWDPEEGGWEDPRVFEKRVICHKMQQVLKPRSFCWSFQEPNRRRISTVVWGQGNILFTVMQFSKVWPFWSQSSTPRGQFWQDCLQSVSDARAEKNLMPRRWSCYPLRDFAHQDLGLWHERVGFELHPQCNWAAQTCAHKALRPPRLRCSFHGTLPAVARGFFGETVPAMGIQRRRNAKGRGEEFYWWFSWHWAERSWAIPWIFARWHQDLGGSLRAHCQKGPDLPDEHWQNPWNYLHCWMLANHQDRLGAKPRLSLHRDNLPSKGAHMEEDLFICCQVASEAECASKISMETWTGQLVQDHFSSET